MSPSAVGRSSRRRHRIDVPVGNTVRITVTSDEHDELHVHGYDLEAELTPGEPGDDRVRGRPDRAVRGRGPPFGPAAVPARRAVSSSSEVLLAHGIGGRQDLPIPFSFALVGAVVALVVSFVALGALWRSPRLDGAHAGVALPLGLQHVVDAPVTRWTLRLLGLAVAAYVIVAAVFGPDLASNPTAAVVYVLLWVGIVPASLLVGPAVAAGQPAAHGAPADCCARCVRRLRRGCDRFRLGWAGGRRLPVCWHSPGWSWQLPTGQRCRCCAPGSRSTPV